MGKACRSLEYGGNCQDKNRGPVENSLPFGVKAHILDSDSILTFT